MIIDERTYLEHYGTLRKSGRYPWGSGETQNKRNKMYLDYVNDLKRQGLTDAQIAIGLGEIAPDEKWSSTKIRALKSIAKNEQRQAEYAMARRLRDKGYSLNAIAERMNKPGESSIRAILAAGEKDDADILQSISTRLKEEVAEKTYVDVGSGNEAWLNISATKLSTAVAMLKEEGYSVVPLNVSQLGTGKETRMKVLAPPGTTQKEVWLNRDKVQIPMGHSTDGGRTFSGTFLHDPIKINPDRVAIRYKDEGGGQNDGVIYVRPGVKDVSLGKSNYAQVRIAIGDEHYLKGMAMYKDDLPIGVDLVFNTGKDNTGNKFDAMKALKEEQSGSFMPSVRRQIVDKDANGVEHVTSAMNLVYEEGDWLTWSHSLASQVLSKQSIRLAKSQLDMTFERRKKELDEISSLTNPTVRRKLLKEFSEETDAAAVHLQAAGMRRQGWHAILPIGSMPPTQVYAPNYIDGERVALIRYPHGGTFEIPDLIVNNNHPEAKRLLGQARDAIGIHHDVAKRLSGADFDGDTVLVIPNNANRLKITPALEALKDFDPRSSYPHYEGMKRMTNTQQEMGKISNLITDMTIRGADSSDISRAVRHSMVVIDAEKHYLNWKQSYLDFDIKQLKDKYQSQPDGKRGASTIISRAKSPVWVPHRKERTSKKGGPINPVTGELEWEPTGKLNYQGKPRQIRRPLLAETKDARELSSGTPMEELYADHSNRLKTMANQARLQLLTTPRLKYSKSAFKTYTKEVDSLNQKLTLAIMNRPLERQAQVIGGTIARVKKDANPDMSDDMYKKIKFQALEEARNRVGAKKAKIEITQDEWDAIQAGAISDSKLTDIIDNADMEIVRNLATPRIKVLMTTAKTRRAQQMLESGYTRAEVAQHLGVSISTLDAATNA